MNIKVNKMGLYEDNNYGIGKEVKLDDKGARKLIEVLQHPQKPYESKYKIKHTRIPKEQLAKLK